MTGRNRKGRYTEEMAKRQDKKIQEIKQLINKITNKNDQKEILGILQAAGVNLKSWQEFKNSYEAMVSGKTPMFLASDLEKVLTLQEFSISVTDAYRISQGFKNQANQNIKNQDQELIAKYGNIDYEDTEIIPLEKTKSNKYERLNEKILEQEALSKKKNKSTKKNNNRSQDDINTDLPIDDLDSCVWDGDILITPSQEANGNLADNQSRQGQYPALPPAIDVDAQTILDDSQLADYRLQINSKLQGHIKDNALKLLNNGNIEAVELLLRNSESEKVNTSYTDYEKYRLIVDKISGSEIKQQAEKYLQAGKFYLIDELLDQSRSQVTKTKEAPKQEAIAQPKQLSELEKQQETLNLLFNKTAPAIRSIASKQGLDLSDNEIKSLLVGKGDYLFDKLFAKFDHLSKKEKLAKIKEILSDIETALPADISGALSMEFDIAQKALSIGGKIDSFIDKTKNYAFLTGIILLAEFLLLPNLFFLGGLTLFTIGTQQLILSMFLLKKN